MASALTLGSNLGQHVRGLIVRLQFLVMVTDLVVRFPVHFLVVAPGFHDHEPVNTTQTETLTYR